MSKKRILLTGDDGYNSIGTRLLIHELRNDYDLEIAATKNQQSGVGGLIHLKEGGTWGEDTVDGIHAYWFEGSPVDCLDCLAGRCGDPYDYVISGMNCGPNVGTNVILSGTFAAAYYALAAGLTKRAMALSWDSPSSLYHKDHNHNDDISSCLEYPGKIIGKLIRLSIKNTWWNVPLLNINVPQNKSDTVRITSLKLNMGGYWSCAIMDAESHKFFYPYGRNKNSVPDLSLDIDVLDHGDISLTLCNPDMTDAKAAEKMNNKIFSL